jgi:hypothetical protein
MEEFDLYPTAQHEILPPELEGKQKRGRAQWW